MAQTFENIMQGVFQNLTRLKSKEITPQEAPDMKAYIKELEAQINQKDMAIDALLIENDQLKDIIKVHDMKIYKMRRESA